jgi:hypothetical protein
MCGILTYRQLSLGTVSELPTIHALGVPECHADHLWE